MGVPLSKATAAVTAHMYASIAPKLHNEMKASLENTMSADLNVSPEVKGFSENYLHYSNNAQDHRQYTNVGMGSGSIIILAMVLSNQITTVLISFLVLSIMFAFAHNRAMKAKEMGEGAIMAFPTQTDDIALRDEGEKEFLGHVMMNVFHIKPKDVAMYLKDSSCSGVAEYVGSMVKFQIEYLRVTYFLTSGEEAADSKSLVGSGGKDLPSHLQGLTLQELGEKLSDKISTHAQAWCKSFQTLNKVLNTGMDQVQNIFDMHGSSNQREQPVDERKMQGVLKLDSLDEATKNMISGDSQSMVAEARHFLHNVGRCNTKVAKVQGSLDRVMELQNDLDTNLLVKEAEAKAKLAKLSDEEAFLGARATNIQSAKAGKKETLKYLEQELRSCKSMLEQARSDEKRYTYWMFGALASVFENDVKLARSRVLSYSSRIRALEEQIVAAKEGRDDGVTKINTDEETNKGAIAKNMVELAACKGKVAEIEHDIKEKKNDIQRLQQEIESKLKGDGYANVQHLMSANMALNRFAQCAQVASTVQDTTTADWRDHIEEFRMLADHLVQAESLKEQTALAWRLRKVINSPRLLPMLKFIKDARAPRTLVPGPNKTFGLENESRSSQLTQPQQRKQKYTQPMIAD